MTAGPTRNGYATISGRGLDWDSVPMRLFQKAKKLGTWDPQALDFSGSNRSCERQRDLVCHPQCDIRPETSARNE